MIKAQDVNKLNFGPKKRSIIHQICISNHLHLMEDITNFTVDQLPSSSSHQVSKYIDLNIRDAEGTTPICFAFRANSSDIIEYLVDNEKVNLDSVSPKYGCPLHLCILKHKFGLAL